MVNIPLLFGPSGETRLHLHQMAQIEDRLGHALAGNAYPRCIRFFDFAIKRNKQKQHEAISAYLVRVVLQDLSKK